MFAAVLLILSLLFGFVQAKEGGADNTVTEVTNLKLGNQTIERVSIYLYSSPFIGCLLRRMMTPYNNRFFCFFVLGLKEAFFYFRHYNFGHIQYMHRISTRTCKIGELFLEPYSQS